jgi:hypothetical protein
MLPAGEFSLINLKILLAVSGEVVQQTLPIKSVFFPAEPDFTKASVNDSYRNYRT